MRSVPLQEDELRCIFLNIAIEEQASVMLLRRTYSIGFPAHFTNACTV